MSDVRNLCMELLAVEEKWRTLAGTSKKKLPDLGTAAREYTEGEPEQTHQMDIRGGDPGGGFSGREADAACGREDDSFEMTFFAGICKFGFWFILLCALGLVLWLGGIYGKVDETDKKADRTYAGE